MNSNQITRLLSATSILLLCISFGCGPPPAKEAKKDKDPGGIVGNTTRMVTEWDPNAGFEIVEEDGKDINIINRNLKTLGKVTHQVGQMKVQQSLELYRAGEGEGNYPKTHEEFMEKVFDVWVKELPAPLTTCEYQYDVENHRLLIVKKKKE